MQISIRTRSVEVTDELRESIEKRLDFSLDTFGDRIDDAFVYLMDLNGPKGGVDKLCQITVSVRGIGDIAVRETASSTIAALNRAARRLKYRISEALRHAHPASMDSIRTTTAAA